MAKSVKIVIPKRWMGHVVHIISKKWHLWERRVKGTKGLPVTCPSCNSPYWNSKPRSNTEKKLLPLKFHGEEVINSNFEEVIKEQDKAGSKK